MFDEKFIAALPPDPLDAALRICERFNAFNIELKSTQNKEPFFEDYLQAFAFAEIYIDVHKMEHPAIPKIDYEVGADWKNIAPIINFFNKWESLIKTKITERKTLHSYEAAKNRYGSIFGKVVLYEFSDDDFKRVQALINKLRDLLAKSKDFEENHKRRLLKKLEQLQAELHKKMSDLDRFWGFFVDSGIALGKFWKEAEPFAEGVKEILQIVCRTQAKAENVEKMLPLRLLKSAEEESDKKKS